MTGAWRHRHRHSLVPRRRPLSERFLELTTDIAGAIDFDGRLVGANPAFTRVGGATVGDRAGAQRARAAASRGPRRARGLLGASSSRACATRAAIEVRLGPARRRAPLVPPQPRRRPRGGARLPHGQGRPRAARGLQDRLGDAEARFRSAFDRSGIGMTITGLDARYLPRQRGVRAHGRPLRRGAHAAGRWRTSRTPTTSTPTAA